MGRRDREWWFNGCRVSHFQDEESSGDALYGDVNILNVTVYLNMVRMANFMLSVFCHNFF